MVSFNCAREQQNNKNEKNQLVTVLHFYFPVFLSRRPFPLSDQAKAMLTELSLASDEFDHFAVQNHNSVTFCLKELRVRQNTRSHENVEERED